jgi:hypothetical protein
MRLYNDNFIIEINKDKNFTINSADNITHYDYIYNPNNLSCDYVTFSVKIISSNKEVMIALIGGAYSFVEDCAIIKDSTLIILQNETLSFIDLPSGNIVDYKNIDTFGCNFAIYEIVSGYIIYGEIEILKLSFNYDVEWRFSALDIFVTIDDTIPFEISDKCIKLHDFNNNYYEIDFDGKLIYEKMAE